MSNLPGKITDPHLSAEEPLTFRPCLRFILQALLLAFGCAAIIRIIGILSPLIYQMPLAAAGPPLRRRHFHLHPDRQGPRVQR